MKCLHEFSLTVTLQKLNLLCIALAKDYTVTQRSVIEDSKLIFALKCNLIVSHFLCTGTYST